MPGMVVAAERQGPMDDVLHQDEVVVGGKSKKRKSSAEIDGDEDLEGNELAKCTLEFFAEADECNELLSRLAKEKELGSGSDESNAELRRIGHRLTSIWHEYQEMPGLLDPHLEKMVSTLVNLVSKRVHQEPHCIRQNEAREHLACSLLYTLCTVRGYKLLARIFPHEACDLEPAVEALEALEENQSPWPTGYILLLWVGMILLTPFDLATIDSRAEAAKGDTSVTTIDYRILNLGIKYLGTPGKLRDSAAWMLGKLFMRVDTAKSGLFSEFVRWTESCFNNDDGELVPFKQYGALQAIHQTLKVASSAVFLPELHSLLSTSLGSKASKLTQTVHRKLRVALSGQLGVSLLPPRIASWRYQRGARTLLDLESKAGEAGADLPAIKGVGAKPIHVPGSGGQDKKAENKDVEMEDDDEDPPEELDAVAREKTKSKLFAAVFFLAGARA